MSGCDKRPVIVFTGEHNVAGFISDQQCSDDSRRRLTHIHDTYRIGQVIDHPDLCIRARRDSDRLKPGEYPVEQARIFTCQVENLQACVGGVGDKQAIAGRRDSQRSELVTFEVDVVVGLDRSCAGKQRRAYEQTYK